MANQVEVTITAKDLLSPKLNDIKNNISSLGSQFDSISRNMGSDRSQGMLGAALFGNLGAQGVLAGLNLVSQGINGVKDSIMEAAKAQTLSLSQAGDLAAQLGTSFDKAKTIVESTQISLSKIAAQLPGENKDYEAILGQISATVAKTSGGNVEAYTASALEITKRLGLLAYTRGANADGAGSSANRALAGSLSFGGMRQLEIFEKNPLLMQYLSSELKNVGFQDTDWQKLTNQVREQVFIRALRKATSDSTIAAYEGTVDSMVAEAKSALFDPRTGIFGALRRVKELGNRNLLDASAAGLTALGALFGKLGEIGSKMGLSADGPMAGIIRIVDFFTDLTNATTGMLNGDGPKMVKELINSFFTGLNKALANADKLLYNMDWVALGRALGNVISFGVSKIFDINWGSLTSIVVNAVSGAMVALGTAITTMFSNLTGYITNPSNISKAIFSGQSSPTASYNQNLPQVGKTNDLFGVIGDALKIPQASEWINNNIPGMKNPNASWNKGLPTIDTKKSSTTSFAPQVNITASSGNANDIATAVMDNINKLFVQYQANNLA
jgi:hypothetical protein